MPQLTHLAEFQAILSDYRMSDEARRLLAEAPLVILTGITSSGRNTIIRELLKSGTFHFVVSDTTRPPRSNDGVMEQNGVEYWFRTEEDMLSDLRSGAFIEAAIIHQQQVSGISLRELRAARTDNKIAINEIETQGVDRIMQAVPGALVPIFVLPPSFAEWQERWAKRGKISAEEHHKRMASARAELDAALTKGYYHFLVNDDLQKAVSGVQKIVSGTIDPAHEAKGRQVAEQILSQL